MEILFGEYSWERGKYIDIKTRGGTFCRKKSNISSFPREKRKCCIRVLKRYFEITS